MRNAYPIMLDVTDRLVVIVGGGKVAARKARGLIDAGATRVRVVSPTFDDRMPPGVERIDAPFGDAHLEGASLVFAATDSTAVNDAVVCDARRRGVWVNRADADADDASDFSTPAALRDGPVTLTVSAAGAPALAATIRDGLGRHMDPRWPAMAEAMGVLRPRLLASLTPDRRRAAFRDLAGEAALNTLQSAGVEGLDRWLADRFPELG